MITKRMRCAGANCTFNIGKWICWGTFPQPGSPSAHPPGKSTHEWYYPMPSCSKRLVVPNVIYMIPHFSHCSVLQFPFLDSNQRNLHTKPKFCFYFQSLSGHTSPVEAVRFGNAEEMVVAGSMSGALKIWDLEAAKSKNFPYS